MAWRQACAGKAQRTLNLRCIDRWLPACTLKKFALVCCLYHALASSRKRCDAVKADLCRSSTKLSVVHWSGNAPLHDQSVLNIILWSILTLNYHDKIGQVHLMYLLLTFGCTPTLHATDCAIFFYILRQGRLILHQEHTGISRLKPSVRLYFLPSGVGTSIVTSASERHKVMV